MTGPSVLSTQILPRYELGETLSIETVPGGFTEESYIVTLAQGRVLVKRCSPGTTVGTLSAKHDLIRFLVENNFPTPSPIPAREGTTWLAVGSQFYETYAYVEGESFSLGNREQIAGVGRVLGKYHSLVKGYMPHQSPGPETSVADFLDLKKRIAKPIDWLSKHRRIRSDERQLVQTIAKDIKEHLPRFQHEKDIVRLIIHGAVEPGNVIFAPSGEAEALLDWSNSLKFVRVFDLASALLKFIGRRVDAVLPGQVGPLLSWPRVVSFANAYRESVTLTESEAGLLPWVMLAIRLNDALWIHEKLDMNYRHELKMVAEIHEWLTKNSAALGALFC